jgi:hypothetical protein
MTTCQCGNQNEPTKAHCQCGWRLPITNVQQARSLLVDAMGIMEYDDEFSQIQGAETLGNSSMVVHLKDGTMITLKVEYVGKGEVAK